MEDFDIIQGYDIPLNLYTNYSNSLPSFDYQVNYDNCLSEEGYKEELIKKEAAHKEWLKDKIDWSKYHLMTEKEIDESYTKMCVASDYSSEVENYKEG